MAEDKLAFLTFTSALKNVGEAVQLNLAAWTSLLFK